MVKAVPALQMDKLLLPYLSSIAGRVIVASDLALFCGAAALGSTLLGVLLPIAERCPDGGGGQCLGIWMEIMW